MKSPCCRATLIEVRQHILELAPFVEESFPNDSTKTVLEKIASTLEAAISFDPKTDDAIKELGVMSAAINDRCPTCGGLGKVVS